MFDQSNLRGLSSGESYASALLPIGSGRWAARIRAGVARLQAEFPFFAFDVVILIVHRPVERLVGIPIAGVEIFGFEFFQHRLFGKGLGAIVLVVAPAGIGGVMGVGREMSKVNPLPSQFGVGHIQKPSNPRLSPMTR